MRFNTSLINIFFSPSPVLNVVLGKSLPHRASRFGAISLGYGAALVAEEGRREQSVSLVIPARCNNLGKQLIFEDMLAAAAAATSFWRGVGEDVICRALFTCVCVKRGGGGRGGDTCLPEYKLPAPKSTLARLLAHNQVAATNIGKCILYRNSTFLKTQLPTQPRRCTR